MTQYARPAERRLAMQVAGQIRKECEMSDDFNIAKVGWWNVTGIHRTSRHLKEDADNIAYYVGNLKDRPFDASVEEAIEHGVEAMTDALNRAKQALAEYRKGRVVREAAE